MARNWNSIQILISSALRRSIKSAFELEAVPEGVNKEPLWGEWSEDGCGREGDIRMCDEVASRFAGICREGEEDVAWRGDEPSPLSAPGASKGVSSSLSGTGESSLSGVSGRDGGGFSATKSCWGLCGGPVDASCEMGVGAGAVNGVGAVGGADAASVSPRRGELGGAGDRRRCMGDGFCMVFSGGKGGTIEAEGTEGELSLFSARGSESLEDVEIVFHEKWSLP
jgi:hypothetical protein